MTIERVCECEESGTGEKQAECNYLCGDGWSLNVQQQQQQKQAGDRSSTVSERERERASNLEVPPDCGLRVVGFMGQLARVESRRERRVRC